MKGLKDKKTGRFLKNIPILRECLICAESFSPRLNDQKYCSRDCFFKYASKLYSKKKIIECKNCNKPLAVSPSRLSYSKNIFCNSLCYGQWMEVNEILNGSKSNTWKGGLTKKNVIIRMSAKYRRWRKSIFERDDYTCQICKVRGGKLQADHIKQFAYFPKLRFELSNGRTLCIDCHKKTDTYLKGSNKNYAL